MYTKKQLRLAELGLLIVTIIWGSGFVVVKSATGSLEPAAIVALRFAIATILMCIVFFPRLKRIDKSCIKAGALAGFLYFLAFYLQTLGAIYVVLVPFLYWIIQKQRPDLYNVSAAFLCIIGIGLLSLNADFSINQGDAFSLLGGVGFTAQIVATAILTQKQDPILLSVTQFGFATIFAAVTSLLTEPIPTHLAPDTLTYILYLGVFSTMIALLLQTVCQKYVPASNASLIMSLESVFGCICGILFLHEELSGRILAGFALIFGAMLLSEVKPAFLRSGFRRLSAPPIHSKKKEGSEP